jgi:hypothetical protein
LMIDSPQSAMNSNSREQVEEATILRTFAHVTANPDRFITYGSRYLPPLKDVVFPTQSNADVCCGLREFCKSSTRSLKFVSDSLRSSTIVSEPQ